MRTIRQFTLSLLMVCLVMLASFKTNAQDGLLDATFNSGGAGANNTVSAIATQTDGKILIGGSLSTYNGVAGSRITRINTDGSIDATFNSGGAGANNTVTAIAIQTDGKILIGGSFTTYNGVAASRITRLNTDGSIDANFNSGGAGANNTVSTMALQTDGKILIGGNFTTYNGVTATRITRINTDGSIDATFNNGGAGASSIVSAIAVQTDGEILIGGFFTTYNGVSSTRITRINNDGSKDVTFNVGGTGASSTVNTIAVQKDGKILIGGNFGSYNSTTVIAFTRLNSDGSKDATFNNGGAGPSNSLSVIVLQTDGKILIGGSFATYNAASMNRIGRLTGTYPNTAPVFTNATNTLKVCQNAIASINSLLQITDVDANQTETYTVTGNPSQGTITTGTTVVSGSNVSPTGWSFTPANGFSGSDVFTISVSDGYGGVASKTVYVTIQASPTISVQPSSTTQNIPYNGTATALSVTAAAGSGSISGYQWYNNSSTTITGATSFSYTPLTTSAGTKSYYAVITNTNGCSSTSNLSGAVTINALIPVVTVTPIGTYTYNASSQGPIAATNTGTGTIYTFSYSGTGSTTYGPSGTAPTNAGDYTATATVAANGNYATSSSVATAFTIGKASPGIPTHPVASSITYGQTLASSILSGGISTVPGTFTFQFPSTVPGLGTSSQGVVFTPTDATNYYTSGIGVNVLTLNLMDNIGLTSNSSATGAYSLRKLSSNYSGYAIQVRRSNDNTLQDIGFVNGNLDTATLKSFIGINSAFIYKWYDQSGNNYDAIQATIANQPRIVNSGIIDRVNGTPRIYFGISLSTNLAVPSSSLSVTTGTNRYIGCVAKIDAYKDYGVFFSNLTTNNFGVHSSVTYSTPNNQPYFYDGTLGYFFSPTYTSTKLFLLGLDNTTGRINGGTNTLTFNVNTNFAGLILGNVAGLGQNLNGSISEFIFINSSLSTTDRNSLEANQTAYYISPDASLSGLAISTGTLTPTFASGNLSYSTSVSNATSSITVTPTVNQANATVSVNGTTVASGVASSTISLNIGTNTITTIVTAQDGSTTKTYTITVIRAAIPPGNALNFNKSSTVVFNQPFSTATDNFTLETWFNWNGQTTTLNRGWSILLINGVAISQTNGYGFQINTANGKIGYFISGIDGRDCSTILPNTWYHLALVRSNGVSTLFVNGVPDANTTTSAPNAPSTSAQIGLYDFAGSVDEVRMWNVVKTQAQIQAAMYTTLQGNEANLAAYYNFDNGIAGGTNTGLTTLTDKTANVINGTLNNFSLSGATSNWVESYAMVVPTATAAVSTGNAGFTANWTAPAIGTVTKYLLDVSTSSAFSSFVTGYQGLSVLSGTAQGVTGLAAGTTYYYRVRADKTSVTGQGGYSSTITVTTLSSDASLSALTTSAGTITPTFAAGTISYTASVSNATTSVTVTPTVNQANGTVTVNGTTLSSGSASGTIALNVGTNTITTVVTAQDGSTTKTYTITITRAASTDATLSALTTTAGAISPIFAAGVLAYTVSVSNATTGITVAPTVNQANATITVNGTAVASGSASGSISLNIGANTITTVVTAQDGSTTNTYTITVIRAAIPPGNALNFDGVDDNVSFSSALSSATNFTSANTFTIECWVNSNSLAQSAFIVHKRSGGSSGGYALFLNYGATGTVGFEVNNANLMATSKIELGKWNHIALVCSAGTATFYINGIAAGTKSITFTSTIDALLLGLMPVNGNYGFNGSMDEVRIWNTARTLSQIQTYMYGTVNASSTGLIAYYNFDNGTANGNNSGLTTLYDQTTNSNNGTLNNFTLTAASGAASNWIESYAMVVPTATAAVSTGNAGFTANWTAPAIGTVTKYLLDVSTNAAFSSFVTGYQGLSVLTGTAQGVSGLTAGTTYYYRVRADKTSVTGQGAYSSTIAVTTLSSDATLSTLTTTAGAISPIFAAGVLAYTVSVSNATTGITVSPTVNQANATITVNGTAVASGSATGSISLSVGTNTITTVVTAQDGSTTNTYTIIVIRAAIPPGNALNFDGVDDYVSFSSALSSATNFTSASTFTIECWINSSSTFGSAFIAHKRSGGNSGGYALNINNAGVTGTVGFEGYNDGFVATRNFDLGKWNHIALVYSAGTAAFYINGVASGTKSIAINSTVDQLVLGLMPVNGNYQFSGSMDEVRIWNTARTSSQIQTNMYGTVNGSSTGLIAYYNFDNGLAGGTNTGLITLTDQTASANNGTLTNFALTTASGAISNWVESYAMVVPTTIAATSVISTSFTANWTAPTVGTVTNYLLDVSTSSSFASFVTGYNALSVSGTSQLVTGLTAGTTYYYRVRAYKTSVAGQGGYSANTTVATCVNTTSSSTHIQCGGTYLWNGVTYSATGTYTKTFTGGNSKGCDSTATLNLTINQSPVIASVAGNALNFTANSNVVFNQPFSTATDNFTLETWVNWNGQITTQNNGWAVVLNNGNSHYNGYGFQINTNNGKVGFFMAGIIGVDCSVVTPNTWYHLALVRKNGIATLFVNGVPDANILYDAPYTPATTSQMGFLGSGGSIDEVRMWNVAKTQAEIQAAMNTTLQGNETNLAAYYNFNQGTAGGNNSGVTTLLDGTANGNNGTLNSFSLTGATSNFVSSFTAITQSVCLGASATRFSPAVTGATSYQWYSNTAASNTGGSSISAATNATYTAPTTIAGTTYYYLVANNAFGCGATTSSIQTVTVNATSTATVNASACGSYFWHGTNYTASTTTATFDTLNTVGCDSLTTLNLTIKQPTTATVTVSACGNYLWHGTNYTASTNTATFDSLNKVGCDSLTTLHLTIKLPTTGTINQTVGTSSFTWHGNTYSVNGNYTFDSLNVAGCDSLTTLQLTILPPGSFSYNTPNVFKVGNSINPLLPDIISGNTLTTFSAGYQTLRGVATDAAGNVYIAEQGTSSIKKIALNGSVTTLGSGFNQPFGLTLDNAGNIYVADTYNNAVKKIAVNGTVTTIGTGFSYPSGVAVDNTGNVFVADLFNRVVKKIAIDGTISNYGSGFSAPYGIGVDQAGNVYVADQFNKDIKKIATDGVTITSLGSGFSEPFGVAVDNAGNIYVADLDNNAVKKIATDGTTTTLSSALSGPTGIALDVSGNIYIANEGNSNIMKLTQPSGTISKFNISPLLPAGLSINSSNGIISGTPTVSVTAISYTVTASNGGGSSTAILSISVCANTSSVTNISICPSALPYSWNGSRATGGTYTYTTTNSKGCDSVATLNLTINIATTSTSTQTQCGGTYLWNGVTYSASGTYTKTFTGGNSKGCDSVATLNLTINIATTYTSSQTQCGGTYLWNGVAYNATGVYTKTFTGGNSKGCDSVATLNLTINSATTSSSTQTQCGGTYLWNGVTYNATGTYTKTFTGGNSKGCDSVATLNLTINAATTSTSSATACGSYLWNGVTYTTSGVKTKTFTGGNSKGCDSVATLNLTINQSPVIASLGNALYFGKVDPNISANNYVSFNSNFDAATNYSSSSNFTIETWIKPADNIFGTFFSHKTSSSNVDGYALFVLNNKLYLEVKNQYLFSTGSVNPGQWNHVALSYASGTATWYINGVASGSASINITPNNQGTALGILSGGNYEFNGGMDEVRIWNTVRTQAEIAANMNKELVGNEAGLYAYYNFNQGTAGGNNSGVTTLLDGTANGNNGTLNSFSLTGATSNFVSSFTAITQSVCLSAGATGFSPIVTGATSYQWYSNSTASNTGGSTISAATSATYTAPTTTVGTTYYYLVANNAFGCGATTSNIQTVTVKAISLSTTNISICPIALPYSWNGSRATGGTYTFTTTNSQGCDSVATLNLTIKQSSTATVTVSACGSYFWHGNTFTASTNTATFDSLNAAGCDSLTTLHLIINNATSSSLTKTVCSTDLPYNWNGTDYTSTGTYIIHLTNAKGCDSLATLVLRVNQSTTSTTNTSVCVNALPYNWNGNNYNVPGSYTIHLTNSVSCDSAATLNLTTRVLAGINASAGSNGSISPNGSGDVCSGDNSSIYVIRANAGFHIVDVLIDGNSIGAVTQYQFLNLTANHTISATFAINCTSTTSYTTQTACSSYLWNGTTYTASGDYIVHFTNSCGMDSAATLHLTINTATSSSLSKRVCSTNLPYNWNGTDYNSTGTYSIHLNNAKGCDSTATLILTVNGALDNAGVACTNLAAVAYSLRKLSSSYAGKAIQVRRSSDNATLDIGFTAGGNLDTLSLKAFVGANDGMVTIWYDQSGNGNNAVQTNAANQPVIISSGTIVTKNYLPSINFVANNSTYLQLGSYPLPTSSTTTINGVYSDNGSGTWARFYDFGSDQTKNFFFAPNPGRWRITQYGYATEEGIAQNAYTSTSHTIWSLTHTGTNMNAYTNGSRWGTASGIDISPSALNGVTNNYIGKSQYSDPYLNGYFQEFIVFSTALAISDQQTLENNQAIYYKFTPTIITQPSTVVQSIAFGGSSTALSVNATTDYGTITGYQWYSNTTNLNSGGTLISGANTSTYTPLTTTSGTTYYYVVVTNSVGNSTTSDLSGAVTVTSPVQNYIWTGATSTDWSVATNWSNNVIPTANVTVTIPSAPGNQPLLSTDINIAGIILNGSIAINGHSFTITGAVTGTGKLKGSAISSLIVNSSSINTINLGTATDSMLANLTISGTGTVILGSGLGITGLLTVSNGTLNTANHLTLKSTSIANTAVVGSVGGTITGNVTVERFIPKGIKAYRSLVTGGVYNTGSIFNNWQESGVNNIGYGIFITGKSGTANGTDASTGFDISASGNKSMYTYPTYNTYATVNNTKTTNLDPYTGYLTVVYGNRVLPLFPGNIFDASANMNAAATIRTTGSLVTGTVTYSNTGVTNSNFSSSVTKILPLHDTGTFIANPYACAIDWNSLAKTNLTTSYYYYEPTFLTGGYQAFVSYNAIAGTNSNPTKSKINRYIQPGQGFWIQTNSTVTTNRQLVITEANKVTNQPLTAVFGTGAAGINRLAMSLWKQGGNIDGAVAVFDNNFTTSYGEEDSKKMFGNGENLYINEGIHTLCIDGLPTPAVNDKIALQMSGLTKDSLYQLHLDAQEFNSNGLTAYLEDAVLNTETVIGANSTVYSFKATTANDNRFTVVFRQAALPVHFVTVKARATEQKTNLISWTVSDEVNIARYEVEQSCTGADFTKIASVKAVGITAYTATDNAVKEGINYYRIKAIDNNGKVIYSNVVTVAPLAIAGSIVVTPNPVRGNSIALQLNNLVKGNYVAGLYNTAGQLLYAKDITIDGNTTIEIPVSNAIANGLYNLSVKGLNNYKTEVIIQR